MKISGIKTMLRQRLLDNQESQEAEIIHHSSKSQRKLQSYTVLINFKLTNFYFLFSWKHY